jgi:hypothetical protein
MRLKLACGLITLISLSACSGLSTGVRSPCFERGGAQVARGLSFTAAPVGAAAETATPTSNPGGADGCDFRNF